jgi:hypothetical protein
MSSFDIIRIKIAPALDKPEGVAVVIADGVQRIIHPDAVPFCWPDTTMYSARSSTPAPVIWIVTKVNLF